MKTSDPTTNFFRHVEKTDTCWLWTGAKNAGGYGIFTSGGKSGAAHKWLYQKEIGVVTAGLDLDHLCRVRHCVNLAHLEPVTRRENIMRGIGPTLSGQRQRAKTHCAHGHAFNNSNTYICKNGARKCNECHRIREEKRRNNKKEKTQCFKK